MSTFVFLLSALICMETQEWSNWWTQEKSNRNKFNRIEWVHRGNKSMSGLVLLSIFNIKTNYLMNSPSDYDSGFIFPYLFQAVDINLALDWITSLYTSLVYKQFFHIPFSFLKCAIIVFNNLLSLFVQCTFWYFLLPLFITHSQKHVKFVSDCFFLLP